MEYIIPLNDRPLDIIPAHVGVIPYAYHRNELYFLLGEEHDSYNYDEQTGTWKLWKGSRTWSFFGGQPERTDKSYLEGAAREAYEESMGIFGTRHEIQRGISYK